MKIKDNSSIPKEDCAEISGIIKKIANKNLDQLAKEGIFVFPDVLKDAEDITSDQMVLQSFNGTYRTSNIMGFLGLGEERLVIESRFSKGKEDFFFLYLLEKVLEVPNILSLNTDAERDEPLFNLFLFLFPQYMKNAVRKGLFKTYQRNEYNDENVKGTIEVAEHIKKNIPFTGKITYSQREYSYDNHLIELIRHTIEYIKRNSYGMKILEPVKNEVKLIVEATGNYKAADRRKVIDENKKNVVRHAYFQEYRDLQQLCILILQSEKHHIGSGTNRVFGILFDGAWLWEEYMNLLIGDKFYHPMNKGGKGAQWLFAGNQGLIYPDFIGRDIENRIMADAKYKPMNNIGNKDYLQVLAYMFRFDAKKAYYLYPESEGMKDMELIMNQGLSFENNVASRDDIRISKHGLQIPKTAESYRDFVNMIQAAENEFKQLFIVEDK